MGRPQLSLASASGIIAVLALWMAGLMSASTFWTTAAATLTLALFLSAVLGAILLRGPDRANCLGFAVFGLVYLVLVNWDWIGGQFGHDLTTGLSVAAERVIPAPAVATSANPSPNPSLIPFELIQSRQIKIGNFVQIGRMSLALIFALLGGFVAHRLEGRATRVERSGRPDHAG